MRQKPKNLKKRLLLRLFVLTILIFVLVGGLILQRSHQALYQALDTELQARLNSLMALTEFEKDGEIDFEFSDEPFGSYGDSSFAKYFLIKRVADGEILKNGLNYFPLAKGYCNRAATVRGENFVGFC